MEEYKKAAIQFMKKMGYLDNPRVLGVILSGSYTTGYQHKGSDVDVHVVLKSGLIERITKKFKIYRGVQVVDGFKFEYFEKPIGEIYRSARMDFNTHNNALLPIVGCGQVIHSKSKELERLREYIKKVYSRPLPKLEGDDAKEAVAIIENRISKLKLMSARNIPEFDSEYYLIVEKIRKAVSRMCGCADIPSNKAIRLYTNKEYRDSFCKSLIPEQEFIDLYIKAITERLTIEEKVAMVEGLYALMTKNMEFDPNDYRISIRSRSDVRSPHFN